MKSAIPCLLALAVLLAPLRPALGQFPTHAAADLALGAPSASEAGPTEAFPWSLPSPLGLAIDPVSGKLFVSSNTVHRVLRFASAGSLVNQANAEAVFGQVNFAGSGSASTQTGFSTPFGLHVDRRGRLWVADFFNNRVLMFHSASNRGDGAHADRVLGQMNFTDNAPGTSAAEMNLPAGVFVDDEDNLWVSDVLNHRVLKFPDATSIANGAAATVVLGQPDFATVTSGTSSAKMNQPGAPHVDASGRLWVADFENNRVLRFDAAGSLATGAPADRVLGQADFDSGAAGGGPAGMDRPISVRLDSRGTLWVADFGNNRVLGFDAAAAKGNGAPADRVVGQPDLFSVADSLGPRGLNQPRSLAFDAQGRLWIVDAGHHRVLRYSPDRAGPRLRLTSRLPRRTSAARLRLAGTASDPGGVASVRFRVAGRFGLTAARGTLNWRARVPLSPGRNRIEIVAADSFGNVSRLRRTTLRR